jgi:HEAT repeat protein
LGFIGAQAPEKVREVIPRLIGFLDSDPMLRENAAYALALIGTKDRQAIEDAVPKLLERIKDSREDVRAASACALGATCNPNALKSLRELLKDSSVINILHPEGKVLMASSVSKVAEKSIKKTKS